MNKILIGNGKIANFFSEVRFGDRCLVFASGVSDSSCQSELEFSREENLFLDSVKKYKPERIIYFSSCAIISPIHSKHAYYVHKKNMELLVKDNCNIYNIYRIPQLIVDIKKTNQLIDFLYEHIFNSKKFNLNSEAYRYVINIHDLVKIVEAISNQESDSFILDVANTYRYKVTEIVRELEEILCKKAKFNLIEKYDGYTLDFSQLNFFLNKYFIDVKFGEYYLKSLSRYVDQKKSNLSIINSSYNSTNV